MATGPPPPYNYDKGTFPPPPGPYEQPPAYSQANVVIVSQPTYPLYLKFNETPVRTICPSCRAEVLTSTHYETGTFTWVACLVIAFVGLWLFCCFIPFCVDACKDVVHTCPNCRHTVGRYNRAG